MCARSNARAREHLEEQCAQREQIGARINGIAANLLRRQVSRRAEDDPR